MAHHHLDMPVRCRNVPYRFYFIAYSVPWDVLLYWKLDVV
jgi:hypothetical protein